MHTVAVVGMACRFPGGLDSIGQLWSALQTRKVTVEPVPPDRWDARRYFASDEHVKGKGYVEAGNFLAQDIRTFDADFFDLPPRVAENIDPQQRLLLEVVWEAFENAGLDLNAHAGTDVGVYVGGFMLDHMITQMLPANRAHNNQNTAAGMMMTMLSNRLSHAFDLHGPSLSIDTACSSSLVAFHYACQDILTGRCSMAIVGGANVMTRPEYPVGMCKGHFLARDGQCKSFDARGDGYGRGEGAGIVILKNLAQARADGDRILATVVGSGINSDGRTPGISMPSGDAQRALAQAVCDAHRVDVSKVRYVECHGTGTAVGDPIEANSIGTVYGGGRQGDERVVIGSIKSNIGHLEAAAGIAGVIKAVLTLQHREATPLGNFETPHPGIPFEGLGLRLADQRIPLGTGDEEILAAVNSFGYGGTNAHVVLQSAPAAGASSAGSGPARADFPWMLPISARSAAALQSLAGSYGRLVAAGTAPVADILYSAAAHRAHLNHRAVVVGEDAAALCLGLEALAAGQRDDRVVTAVQPFQGVRAPVLVFTGMGPQWWGMGQALYRDEPVYRAAVDEADRVFARIAGFSILAEMQQPEAASRISRTQYAQPANFIVQVGITAVLRAAGVVPGAVVGHSVGEVASAYASGALSLEEALRVSYHRSRLQATTAGSGRMLAVGLGLDELAGWLVGLEGRVEVAAVNGPASVTLSGQTQPIEDLARRLKDREVFHRLLAVEVPYHSHLMDPIMGALRDALHDLSPREPAVALYSTVAGRRVQEGGGFDADYWPLNVRQPVAFMQAVNALIDDGFATFVEVGPHPVLAASLRDCARSRSKELRLVETLRRGAPERARLQLAVAQIFASGCDIDWRALNGTGRFTPLLPNYPWQRERHWLETERAAIERLGAIDLPLLGIQEYPASRLWRNDLEHEALAYLREHGVSGTAIMPAAGYVETLLELAGVLHPDAPGWVLRDIDIHAPLLIASSERALDYVTTYDPVTRSATVRSIESGKIGEGHLHMTAGLGALPAGERRRIDLAALRAGFGAGEDAASFYQRLARFGLNYGPRFQTIRELYVSRAGGTVQVLSRIVLDARDAHDAHAHPGYRAHPAALDAAFQSLVGMLGDDDKTYLPTGFAELRLLAATLPAAVWCHCERRVQTARHLEADITLYDADGAMLAVVRGARVTASSAPRGRTDAYGDAIKRQLLCYEWADAGPLAEPRRLGHWLIVEGRDDGLNTHVAQGIEAFGGRVCARLRQDGLADVAAVLKTVGQIDGVAFLHATGATLASDDPTAIRALAPMAALTRQLASLPAVQRPRLYAVTQSAFQVGDHDAPVEPGQTAVNGFVRVGFNELDGMRFSTVDLPRPARSEDLDNLVLELLCDAAEDEVALRQGRRWFSELADRPLFASPPIEQRGPHHPQPFLVRRLGDKEEGVGTVKLIEAAWPDALRSDEVELRVEAVTLPLAVLNNPATETLDQPWVEMVGVVLAVGSAVHDLVPGARVYGFAPAELASHLRGSRNAFHLVPLPGDAPAATLLVAAARNACADRLVDMADLAPGAPVLVYADEAGLAVAEALCRTATPVVLLSDVPPSAGPGPLANAPRCAASFGAIEEAVAQHTGGQGFGAIAAPASAWSARFGWRALALGGVLIDTEAQTRPIELPHQAAHIARADLRVLTLRRERFAAALGRAVARVLGGEAAPGDSFTVSVRDLALEKLALPAADMPVTVTFETEGPALPVRVADGIRFHADASYLVTGGLGGFGQKTAHWLVDHGARHLVLIGRHGADTAERQHFVAQLQGRGVQVLCVACDAADVSQMKALFATMAASQPPLRGVFHTAAVIVDEPVAELDPGHLATVMRNKADAALILHQLTCGMALDHFVLYSSIANLVGNSRQASYASANGFLDGLAWHRRALGLPALSVNWGAISDVGVVTRDDKLEQFLRYIGLRGMVSAEALALLGQAMRRSLTQVGPTLITNWADWARYETLGGLSRRFAALIAADAHPDSGAKALLKAELAGLPAQQRFDLLASLIAAVVAGELDVSPDAVPLDRTINQLGVDSLMSTEIQQVLDRDLGITVSVLELLGEATIRTIADKALRSIGFDAGGPSEAVTSLAQAA